MERIKQVILIRKDLKMRRGKEIAQGSHASMQFLVEQINAQFSTEHPAVNKNDSLQISIELSKKEAHWLKKGMAKVCLRVDSEEQLLAFHEKAVVAGIKSNLIQDSGRTEFNGQPTLTACAIGPDYVTAIDEITGELVPY
jgi:PTH2 family peptidyl-tRNA hydrolase